MAASIAFVFVEGHVFSRAIVGQERGYVDQYLASIPDPSTLLSIATFARNKSVAREIGISQAEQDILTNLINECGGSLSSPQIKKQFLANEPIPSPLEFSVELAAKKQRSLDVVEDILDPNQRQRLQQIALQIEISRVGLVEAIISGFLGRELSIRNSQKPTLELTASRIEKKLHVDLINLCLEGRSEVLGELDASTRDLVVETLGVPFFFRDEPFLGFKREKLDHSDRMRAIPNPASILAMASCAINRSVAKELILTPEEVDILKGLVKDAGGSLDNPQPTFPRGKRMTPEDILIESDNKKRTYESIVREIINPTKEKRLRQIVYQIEVSRVGLVDAIDKGYLGIVIGTAKKDIAKLAEKDKSVQKKMDEASRRIVEIAYQELLRQLDPLQQLEMKKKIGKPFVFHEDF